MPVPRQAWESPPESQRLFPGQVLRSSLQQRRPAKHKRLLTADIRSSEAGLSMEKAQSHGKRCGPVGWLLSCRARKPLVEAFGGESNCPRYTTVFPAPGLLASRNTAAKQQCWRELRRDKEYSSFQREERTNRAVKWSFPCAAGDCSLSPGLESCPVKIIGSVPWMAVGTGSQPFYSELGSLLGAWPHLRLSSREPFSVLCPSATQPYKTAPSTRQETTQLINVLLKG